MGRALIVVVALVLILGYATATSLHHNHHHQKGDHPVRDVLAVNAVEGARRKHIYATLKRLAGPKGKLGDICPGGTTNCNDTCCENTGSAGFPAESCCPDPKNGGVCCIAETTTCCPPNPELDHPSRCCPRWYVCCDVGRYGCCDPDTMRPMESNQLSVLLEETSIWTDASVFYSLHVDMATGNYTQKKLLPGAGDFNNDGEITRVFMYNQNRNVFYAIQANFTGPKKAGDPDRQIKLYTIDPISLKTVESIVTGADDEVTGYKYVDGKNTIVMATKHFNGQLLIGYKFYHLDVATAVATLVSTVLNPTGGDTYAGWFHEVAPDMSVVYRLGFKNLIESQEFGVGITNISQSAGVFESWVNVPMPLDHLQYNSIHFYPGAVPNKFSAHSGKTEGTTFSPIFISLAPGDNYTNPDNLAVFMWPLSDPGKYKKLGEWPNAHIAPYFGPIAESLNIKRTKYAALVSAKSPLGDTYDAWSIGVLDLESGNTTEKPLKPYQFSSTTSVSGFGIPASSDVFHF